MKENFNKYIDGLHKVRTYEEMDKLDVEISAFVKYLHQAIFPLDESAN